MSQETKRQHFVPRTYLNKFGVERKNGDYQIHALDKSNLENIFPINTAKVCVKKDFYTIEGKSEEDRQLIENFYGDNIESKYNEFYELITNDDITTISSEQRNLIISTIVTLLFRTTKLPNIHNQLLKRVFDMALTLCTKEGKDYFFIEKEKIHIENKNVDELYKEYIADQKTGILITQLEVASKLIDIRNNNLISIIKLNENPKYIISDNPVIIYNSASKIIAPFDPDNELSLPVNDSYTVYLYNEHRFSCLN